MALPEKAATFNYTISQQGDKLQLMMKTTRSKSFFAPQEYGALREFYKQIIDKQAEQIVLRKK